MRRFLTQPIVPAVCALTLIAGCNGPTQRGMEVRKEMRERHAATVSALAYQQAEQGLQLGNLDDALQNIDAALYGTPENADFHVLRGRILMEQQRLEEAMSALSTATQLMPGHAEGHYYAGIIFQRWSNNEAAASSFETAYELDQTQPEYLMAAVETRMSLSQLEEADALITRGRTTFAHHAPLRRVEGHVALLRKENDRAVECFRQAMLLAPEDTEVIEELAFALMRTGEFVEARHYLEELLANPETSERRDLRLMLARTYVATGRLVDARGVYLRLNQEDASDQAAAYELGLVCYRLGDVDRLRSVSRQLQSDAPGSVQSHIINGLLSDSAGKNAEALHCFDLASRRAVTDPQPLMLMAMSLRKLDREDEARETMIRARSLAAAGAPESMAAVAVD